MSYLISEHGQKRVYLGVEGETYTEDNGKAVMKPEVRTLLDADRKAYDKQYGADDTYWMLQNNILQKKWQQEIPEAEKQLKEWTYPYTAYTAMYDISFPSGSDEANRWIRIQEEWGQILPQLLLADSEKQFDDYLNDYKKRRQDYGYDELMEKASQQIKVNKEKLRTE